MITSLESHIPSLRRYARSLTRDAAAADDLVQDCLERAISRWHQRRGDGNLRRWLFTILHNLAMNRFRQATRRGVHVGLDDADESVYSERATQEDGIMDQEVMNALEQLTPEHRSVLLLVSVEDLSYAEVAHILDIPLGTVMSRLSRARAKFSALLENRQTLAIAEEPILRRVK